ncbi:acyloxyacyl hydrolase [Comamonas guangdongensis]|uniref:acyloxyacyl hydrolase n=1 Tax=Comamonas guangdongensis TaxID=510515 RepID=UPI003F6E19B9
MNKLHVTSYCATSLFAALLCTSVSAQPVQNWTPAMYLQYGTAEHGSDAATLGVTIPWKNWNYALGPGVVTGYWDVWGSRWSGDYQGSSRSNWVVGAKPTFRWRAAQGQSPWFLEAGIGVSYATNRRYVTDHKDFSTRFNFGSHIGVGYLFGEQQKNEISLRLEHYSNAGIKEPNPGENFLQLRFARHF